MFDALEAMLVRVAPQAPRQAFAIASMLGRMRRGLSRRWPSSREILTLFPHVTRHEATAIASRIAGLEARNRVSAESIRGAGLDFLRPFVSSAEVEAPAILVGFHMGAAHALGPALERMPHPVLAFRERLLFTPRGSLTIVATEGTEAARAASFHRALVHLRGGGLVVLAPDVVPATAIAVPCLGRSLPLARGPFALARLSGAPTRPIVARWEGSQVQIEIGEALAGDDEGTLALAAGAWLERYLLARPDQLGLALLHALLGK